MSTASLGGAPYFLTFIGDWSRYTIAYYLRSKAETLECFMDYVCLSERQTGHKLLTLQSDNGGEYISSLFTDFCSREGILQQFTVPYSHEQNPIAERKNRTLQQTAKTLLHAAGLPQTLWAEAISTSVYILDCLPTSFENGTPFQRWTGKRPYISHLCIFGCHAYSHIPDEVQRKMDYKATK